MDDTKKKKEKFVILIGLILISAVFFLTLARSNKGKSEDASNTAIQPEVKLDFPKITAADLDKKIKTREKIFIVDTRSDDEYNQDHIMDSFHIKQNDLLIYNPKFDANTDIVLLAMTMEQANDAGKYLQSKGFQKIWLLSGGMKAWKNNNAQTISWPDPTSFANQAKVTYLSADDLKKNLDDKNTAIYIIDVRQTSFFSPHIPGAANIDSNYLENRRKEIPLNKQIIVYGDNELEGFQGGVLLNDLGFLSISVLKGGFSAWQEKNYPVER